MLLESTIPTTFWSFALIQANFLYNRSPHSYLDHQTTFYARYGLSENYESLIPFGCRVNNFIQKEKRNKIDNTTKPGIMFGYSTNSTELYVLYFESSEIIKAPSTSTFNQKDFPGIPADTL